MTKYIVLIIIILLIFFISKKLECYQDFIPKPLIYIISLDKCKDRRDNINKILKKYKKQFISAVDGNRMSQNERDKLTVYKTREMTPGEVGCFLSHRKCWKRIQNLPKNQWVVILEDDVSVGDVEWYNYLQDALHEIPNSCNLLFLHADTQPDFYNSLGEDCNFMFQKKEIDSDFGKYTIRSRPRLNTHAYCLNAKASKVLLKNSKNIILPVDVQWQLPNVRKELGDVFATKKPLFIIKDIFTSTVQA